MRILVTGGSGRLGVSVVSALAAEGHSVVSVDRSSSDAISVPQRQIDLSDERETDRLLAEIAPDAVVQLAAIAVPFSAPEREILITNTTIAWTVLEAARRHGVSAVLAASSPTVIGYGAPRGWLPQSLPIDETHAVAPWNAYALSKVGIERMVQTFATADTDGAAYGSFRPCFVLSPEEWSGAPTQQGHTVEERLRRPELAAVSLFNYVDARDAAGFVAHWLAGSHSVPNGSTFFVGAADALAVKPLAELLPTYLPGCEELAAALTGTAPAFSSASATELLGWTPSRSWRTELPSRLVADLASPSSLMQI